MGRKKKKHPQTTVYLHRTPVDVFVHVQNLVVGACGIVHSFLFVYLTQNSDQTVITSYVDVHQLDRVHYLGCILYVVYQMCQIWEQFAVDL